MPTTPTSRDVANRLAGWFFIALGAALVAVAFSVSRQRFMVAAWCFGAVGVAVLAFGVFAPRRLGYPRSILSFLS
jgi:hypothetical protein